MENTPFLIEFQVINTSINESFFSVIRVKALLNLEPSARWHFDTRWFPLWGVISKDLEDCNGHNQMKRRLNWNINSWSRVDEHVRNRRVVATTLSASLIDFFNPLSGLFARKLQLFWTSGCLSNEQKGFSSLCSVHLTVENSLCNPCVVARLVY